MADPTFLAITGADVARAAFVDGGWTVHHMLAGQPVACLAADPFRPVVVYAGTRGEGVLRSDDGGQSWQPAGLAGQVVKALAASPTQPGVVYAGTKPPALYVSRDGGGAWTELPAFRRARAFWWLSPAEADLKPYVQAIALSPTDPQLLLIGIEAGAVLRSADGGQSWQGHRPGALRDCHSLTLPGCGRCRPPTWMAGPTLISFARPGAPPGKSWAAVCPSR